MWAQRRLVRGWLARDRDSAFNITLVDHNDTLSTLTIMTLLQTHPPIPPTSLSLTSALTCQLQQLIQF